MYLVAIYLTASRKCSNIDWSFNERSCGSSWRLLVVCYNDIEEGVGFSYNKYSNTRRNIKLEEGRVIDSYYEARRLKL